jgi:hypothetical protein
MLIVDYSYQCVSIICVTRRGFEGERMNLKRVAQQHGMK